MSRLIGPPKIPRAAFQFGQRVCCHPLEAEFRPFEAVITGINYDFRRDSEPLYTLTEDDRGQSDGWTEDVLSPV